MWSKIRNRKGIVLATLVWLSCIGVAVYSPLSPFGDSTTTTLTSTEAYEFGQSDYFRTVFGNVGYVFAGGPQVAIDAFELQYLPAVADGRPKLCVVVREFRLPNGNTVIQQDGNIHQC